jgi:hypothetical protein
MAIKRQLEHYGSNFATTENLLQAACSAQLQQERRVIQENNNPSGALLGNSTIPPTSVVNPDPHGSASFDNLDPHPHRNKNPDPDTHQINIRFRIRIRIRIRVISRSGSASGSVSM